MPAITAILFGFIVTISSSDGGTVQILTSSQSPALCESLRQQTVWQPEEGTKIVKSERCTMFLVSPLVPETPPKSEPEPSVDDPDNKS